MPVTSSLNFKLGAALVTAVLGAPSAFASGSPAQAVFDETVFYLATQYGGFSEVNLRELPARFQPKLDAACMDRANTCPAEVAYPIVSEMVGALGDEHTNFYPKGGTQLRELLGGRGSSTGFGIRPTKLPGGLYVRSVQVGSPAEKAGVRRGDRILALDGAPLPKDEKAAFDLWDKVNAKDNDTLIGLTRQGARVSVSLRPVKLEAAMPSLEQRADGMAVLHVPDFIGRGMGTVGPKIHALVLEAEQANARAIVVDLRDNPGGLVTECFGGVAAFAPQNLARRLVSRAPLQNSSLRWNDGSVLQTALGIERSVYTVNPVANWTKPVAVLVNQYSASCAEFFAFDMLEAKRGAVVGETTYGVGNTATGFAFLSDGSALQVTFSQRVKPDGTPFPAKVTPTLAVPDDLEAISRTGVDAVLNAALETLK
jgi:carboxyl-terminal processing protease